MQPQTPGVYTIEKNAFSNSVVGVDTAIPAFVGYTEQATYDGKKLTNIPTKIESFKQFQDYFGGEFLQQFDLNTIVANPTDAQTAQTNQANEVFAVLPSPIKIDATKADYDFNLTPYGGKPYYLYKAIHLFYLNGGSTCYIVSIGDYSKAPDYNAFINGIDLLVYEQDPTMLLCPDALRLEPADYNTVVQHMLMHCEDMQSRVALFDVYKGAVTKPDDMDARITTFREGVGQNSLKYGIAYFPWVQTSLVSDTEVSFLNLTDAALGKLRDLLNMPLPAIISGGTAAGNTVQTGQTPPPVSAAAVVAAAASAAATDAAALTDKTATANAHAVEAAAKAALANGTDLTAVSSAVTGAPDAADQSDGVKNATATGTAAALVAAIASAAVAATPADTATLANAKAVEAAAQSAVADSADAKKAADAASAIDATASAAKAAQAALAPPPVPATPAASPATVNLTNATAGTLSQAIAAKALTDTARTTAKNAVDIAQRGLDDANAEVGTTATQLLNAYNALQQGDAADPNLRTALSNAQDAADNARDQAITAASQLATMRQHLAKAIAADDAAAKVIVTAKTGIAAGSMPPKPALSVNGKPYVVPGLPTEPPKPGKPAVLGPPVNIFDQAIALLSDRAMDKAVADPTDLTQLAKLLKDKRDAVNNSLLKLFPAYKTLMTVLLRYLNTLPVAPAMAGVYTAVDNSRGVWKAPANVSLTAVVAPTVSLSDKMQANLNVDALTGKSGNAIRNFKGLGVMVWGARTLDGNSKDWRFINVRRTMIFIEQSVKLACRSYVFEPNDANTWTNVQSMISSFLFNLWKQGALAGAVPADAYSVTVGLGSTMTPDDILEGLMNVTVLVAIVHPAEFIMLTFQQQQQKS